MSEADIDKMEELRIIKLLYNILKDKTVQRRFDTTITVDMQTGEVNEKRVLDECEVYLINKYKILAKELGG